MYISQFHWVTTLYNYEPTLASVTLPIIKLIGLRLMLI